MSISNMPEKIFVDYLRQINNAGGPTESDWPSMTLAVANLREVVSSEWFKEQFAFIADSDYPSCFKRIMTEPEGYPGDYQTLWELHHGRVMGNVAFDKLTTNEKQRRLIENWDQFIFNQHAVGAIKHRSEEVKDVLGYMNRYRLIKAETKFSVKDIACGWGLFPDAIKRSNINPNFIDYIAVDASAKAIDFTKKLIEDDAIDFRSTAYLNARISGVRAVAEQLPQSELTWSSGLFDYFGDELFIRAGLNLCRSTERLLVIGNMSRNSISIPMMELLGWTIECRTKAHLVTLGQKILARYAMEMGQKWLQSRKPFIQVTQDPTGVQYYLKIHL